MWKDSRLIAVMLSISSETPLTVALVRGGCVYACGWGMAGVKAQPALLHIRAWCIGPHSLSINIHPFQQLHLQLQLHRPWRGKGAWLRANSEKMV